MQKKGDIFTGGFEVPKDVSLENKEHTFFIEMSYSLGKRAYISQDFLIEFSAPEHDFNKSIYFSESSQDSFEQGKTMISSKDNFLPKTGNYTFKFSPINKQDIELEITKVKIIIAEKK